MIYSSFKSLIKKTLSKYSTSSYLLKNQNEFITVYTLKNYYLFKKVLGYPNIVLGLFYLGYKTIENWKFN